jgi:predicted Rossmann-fold nucleotide-binding protein
VAGYFDHLEAFLEHAIDQAFVRPEYRPMIIADSDPKRLLERFRSYRAPEVKKWISEEET